MSECRRLPTPYMWLEQIVVDTRTALWHPTFVHDYEPGFVHTLRLTRKMSFTNPILYQNCE